MVIDKPIDISNKKSKEYVGPKVDQCSNSCKKKTKDSIHKGIEKGFGPVDVKNNSLEEIDEESDEFFDAEESFSESIPLNLEEKKTDSSSKKSKETSKETSKNSSQGSKEIFKFSFFTNLFNQNKIINLK